MILVVILYILFASTFTLGKAALMYMSPFLLIGMRMMLGGTILLSYYFIIGKYRWNIAKKDYGYMLQIILFHIFFSYTLEFWGMEQVSSAKACLFYNLAPFITAIFSYFFFAERLTLRQICGLIIGFAGFIPVLVTQLPHEGGAVGVLFFSIHEIALILSVVSSAWGWIVMKHLTDAGYSFVLINGVGMVGGGVLSFMVSLGLEGIPAMKDGSLHNGLAMLCMYSFGLIIIANIICYNLYGYLLAHYSPTLLSLTGLTTPLFAALLGWIFLGEVVTWHFFATFALIMCGVYLFYKGKPLVFEEKGL